MFAPGSPAGGEKGAIPSLMLGTYAHPKSFWEKGARLDEHDGERIAMQRG